MKYKKVGLLPIRIVKFNVSSFVSDEMCEFLLVKTCLKNCIYVYEQTIPLKSPRLKAINASRTAGVTLRKIVTVIISVVDENILS